MKLEDLLLDTWEAAEYLGLARETIVRYRQRGHLVATERDGRKYLFSLAELNRFNATRKKPWNPRWKKEISGGLEEK